MRQLRSKRDNHRRLEVCAARGDGPRWPTIFVFLGLPRSYGRCLRVFNKIQSSARQDIERCWGMLINRFLIFYSPLPFRGSDHLVRASKLIHACMVLHNILLQMNDPDFPDMRGYPDWFPEEEEYVEEEKDAIRTPNLFEPMAVRDALAKYLGSMYTLTDGRRLVQKDDAEITELRFFPHKQLAEKIASL